MLFPNDGGRWRGKGYKNESGFGIVENEVPVHDIHPTRIQIFEIDFEKLIDRTQVPRLPVYRCLQAYGHGFIS